MKLHELIQMAKDGKEFKARTVGNDYYHTQKYFIDDGSSWTTSAILNDWEVDIKKEPRVIYVNEYSGRILDETPAFLKNNHLENDADVRTIEFVERIK